MTASLALFDLLNKAVSFHTENVLGEEDKTIFATVFIRFLYVFLTSAKV